MHPLCIPCTYRQITLTLRCSSACSPPVFRWLDTTQFHSYCDEVKNITLSVADELYEQSRVIAAQRKTTVTGLVREYLESLSNAEQRREQARSEILKMIGSFDGKIGRMPTRQERNARR